MFDSEQQDQAENAVTAHVLRQLGVDELAYVKETTSDQLMASFPALPQLEKGLTLWALFSAEGEPLALADKPADLHHSAAEHHLVTASVH